jgi:SSS family solute:Na+ symporter
LNPEFSVYLFYLLLYIALLIGLGAYYRRKSTDISGYLVAGRSQGTLNIMSTFMGSVLGSVAFIGFVGMGYATGINGWFFWTIPAGIFTLILVHVFGSAIKRTNLYTVPDVFAVRFGRNSALFTTIVQMIFIIPHIAITFIAMGAVTSTFFKISPDLGIIVGFFVITTYVFFGGFRAVIGTDKIQLSVVLLGLVLLFLFSLDNAGGIQKILENTPSGHWNPLGRSSLLDFFLIVLSIAPFYMIQQAHWQRIFASKDIGVAKKGFTIGIILITCIYALSFSIGIIARNFLPLDLHPDMVFPEAIATVFPSVVGGILLIGLLAAIMSSADTFIMSGSAVATKNIYQQYVSPRATEKQLFHVSRYAVMVVAVFGLIIALFGGGIIPTAILTLKICGSGLVFPFLALMFWRRATSKGIIAGMISGVLVTVLWEIVGNPLGMHAIPGYLASLISLIIVSLVTSHGADENTEPLYSMSKRKTGNGNDV